MSSPCVQPSFSGHPLDAQAMSSFVNPTSLSQHHHHQHHQHQHHPHQQQPSPPTSSSFLSPESTASSSSPPSYDYGMFKTESAEQRFSYADLLSEPVTAPTPDSYKFSPPNESDSLQPLDSSRGSSTERSFGSNDMACLMPPVYGQQQHPVSQAVHPLSSASFSPADQPAFFQHRHSIAAPMISQPASYYGDRHHSFSHPLFSQPMDPMGRSNSVFANFASLRKDSYEHPMLMDSQFGYTLPPTAPAADVDAAQGRRRSSTQPTNANSANKVTKAPRSRGRRVSNVPCANGARMYTCTADNCGKVFKRSEHLKRHIRSIHTLEKRKLDTLISFMTQLDSYDLL